MNRKPANGFRIITDHNLDLLRESRKIAQKATQEFLKTQKDQSYDQVSLDESADYITRYYVMWVSNAKNGEVNLLNH